HHRQQQRVEPPRRPGAARALPVAAAAPRADRRRRARLGELQPPDHRAAARARHLAGRPLHLTVGVRVRAEPEAAARVYTVMSSPLHRAPAPIDRADLVAAHGPAVYALCRRLTPDPDDCYQEIWEKVFRALPRFDPGGAASVRTWILTIAHRHLVDRHRRRLV